MIMNWKVRWVYSFIAVMFVYSFTFLEQIRSQEVKQGTERDEKDVLIKRLEVRDKMLEQFSAKQVSLESVENRYSPGREISSVKRNDGVFLLVEILFIFSLGFLLWLFKQKAKTDNRNKELDQLKNVVESFKFESQKKDMHLAREKDVCESLKEALSKKEAQWDRLNVSFESLKQELRKKEDKIDQNEAEAVEKSGEKRFGKRISLTKDFNRTVILRIKYGAVENIKCFAGNISSGGLCFETKREFNLEEPVDFRLFFYGDKVPIIKARGDIVWEKKIGGVNHYGISFNLLDDKDQPALNSYVVEKM